MTKKTDSGASCAVENGPATIDGTTLRVLPTPPTIHLKVADDVRLEMARVYRDMRVNKIDMGDGTKLVYALSQIARVIEVADVQVRMEALERVLKERKMK
jgi:hypothetical protein